jgi:hypothetical protein
MLTGNVLVSTEGSGDKGTVCKGDAVLGCGREQALEESNGRVKDDMALASSLGTNIDLAVVGKVRLDSTDVGQAGRVKVCLAKVLAEREQLGLNENQYGVHCMQV